MKRLSVFAVVVTILMGLLGTAPVANATDIIVVAHGTGQNPFWAVAINGMKDAAKRYGVNAEWRGPETFDMVQMGQLIEAAVNQEPDGLVVSIPDPSALGPAIKKAVAAGIPVISINSGADVAEELGILLHVGQGEYEAGLAAGKMLKAAGGTKGICVNHEVGNTALDDRCRGFTESFGGPVKVLPVNEDAAEIKAKVKAALDSDKKVDTVFALNAAPVAPAVMEGIEATGQTGKVKFGSTDLSPQLLKAVMEGSAEFGIDQQPYLQGYLPVAFLALMNQYGVIPGGDVPSGPNVITKDKAGDVMKFAAKGIR